MSGACCIKHNQHLQKINTYNIDITHDVAYNNIGILYLDSLGFIHIVQKGKVMAISSTLSSMMGKYRYTIQYVHEQTGLARNTISNLYNDKVTRIDFDTLDKLCLLFECDISDLLCRSEEKFETTPHYNATE